MSSSKFAQAVSSSPESARLHDVIWCRRQLVLDLELDVLIEVNGGGSAQFGCCRSQLELTRRTQMIFDEFLALEGHYILFIESKLMGRSLMRYDDDAINQSLETMVALALSKLDWEEVDVLKRHGIQICAT
ncbi:hypothetical protein Tco_0692375 [Tanacetum coccineum]